MCEFQKTIVFVRKYTDCSDLYDMLEHKLGIEITNPMYILTYLSLDELKCLAVF